MKRATTINICLFYVLVAIGVGGRWLGTHDDWAGMANFTPIVAIGLFAGFYFARRWVALLVPLAALAISNICLDSYGSWLMLATVYGSFLLAPLLGRILRGKPSGAKALRGSDPAGGVLLFHDRSRRVDRRYSASPCDV